MKLIRAIIRPEREELVVAGLEAAGIVSLTKMDVLGRGQQRGIQVGASVYDEIPKVQLLIVVEDERVETAVVAIEAAAKTGQHGDGKMFISPVDAAYTIRTGEKATGASPPVASETR